MSNPARRISPQHRSFKPGLQHSVLTVTGYLARRHKHEQAKKSMLRLSGNVPGYDIEREYAVLSQNVANDEAQQAIAKRSTYVELFRGING